MVFIALTYRGMAWLSWSE